MPQLHRTTRSTTHTTRGARLAVVAAATLAAAALLTGCATSTSAGSSHTSSASATHAASSSAKIPATFPKAVPLVAGDVLVARGDASDGWSATVSPEGTGGFAAAQQALVSKGFTKQAGGSATQATYTNADYTVSISTPGSSVTYIISTR